MGHCRKILGFKIVDPISTFYSDLFAVELAENFHVHLRNLRLELDHEEFEQIAKGFVQALKHWKKTGGLPAQRYERPGDRFLTLHTSKISPIPSQWNPSVSNDELRVELQQWADYIHLHLRHFRLEFTVEEFMAFSEVIGQARRALEESRSKDDNPRRLGKFHRANPAGRVSSTDSSYWTQPPVWKDVSERPYASSYHDSDDANLKGHRSRQTDSPLVCWMDINDLYSITAYHAAELHPWMVDGHGICWPLLNRYDFVSLALDAGGRPSKDKIRETAYWELLGRPIDAVPRDGSSDWIYADCQAQCERFLELIRLVKDRGYLGMDYDPACEQFEAVHAAKILRNGTTEEVLRNKDAGYPGLMTVRPAAGAYCMWNGLHRLAILKAFWDRGLLVNNRVLVRKTTGTPFEPGDLSGSENGARRPSVRERTVSLLRRVPGARHVGSRVFARFPRLREVLLPTTEHTRTDPAAARGING